MQRREWKWYIIFAIVALAAIGASVWTYVDMIGLFINIGAVLAMVSIIVWSLGYLAPKRQIGLRYLATAAEELRSGAETIRELSHDTSVSVDDALREREADTPLFRSSTLHQAYSAHRRELDRLYRDGSSFRFSDIAEYVNQNMLDHIGNASFCDIVGGSMTGLGILGTFLGLMIGLQDFDPSTADAMMLTIPTLIDGIKIAFLTSIFGVVFSLLFNMYSRGIQEDAADALDGFLGAYYKYVIPQPENDAFTQLIRYQQSQTDSMAQFAEDISLTMANSLKENVAPTFQRIEASIATLTERLAKSQSETMDEVASRFVENMDKAMGNQLTHLGENIQKLCQWQDETIGKMEQTIHAFSEAGEKVGAVNAKLDASFDSLEQYVQNITALQEKVNSGFADVMTAFGQVSEKMDLQNRTALEGIEAQKNLVRSMNDAASDAFEKMNAYHEATLNTQRELAAYSAAIKDTLRTTSESVAASIDKASADFAKTTEQVRNEIVTYSASVQSGMNTATQTAISAMNEAMQEELRQMQTNMEAIEKTQRAFIDGMNKSSEQLTTSAAQMSAASQDLTNNLDKAMTRTYQEIDRQLAEIVRHLSGTIADIRDVTEQMPKLLASSAAQTHKTTEQYLATISESQKQLAQEVRQHNQAMAHRGEK